MSRQTPDAAQLHVHRRAHRHMEKRFLLHLWRAWRARTRLSPVGGMPVMLATASQGRQA